MLSLIIQFDPLPILRSSLKSDTNSSGFSQTLGLFFKSKYIYFPTEFTKILGLHPFIHVVTFSNSCTGFASVLYQLMIGYLYVNSGQFFVFVSFCATTLSGRQSKLLSNIIISRIRMASAFFVFVSFCATTMSWGQPTLVCKIIISRMRMVYQACTLCLQKVTCDWAVG